MHSVNDKKNFVESRMITFIKESSTESVFKKEQCVQDSEAAKFSSGLKDERSGSSCDLDSRNEDVTQFISRRPKCVLHQRSEERLPS